MTTVYELDAKVTELRNLQTQIEELTAEAEAIKDTIKAVMLDKGDRELSGHGWKAAWQTITSKRLDTAALKKAAPEVYETYSVTSTSSRFTVR